MALVQAMLSFNSPSLQLWAMASMILLLVSLLMQLWGLSECHKHSQLACRALGLKWWQWLYVRILKIVATGTVVQNKQHDSAGLLAYIVEKFRSWSDCGGDLESRFSKDDVLMDISLYWFNKNITSSFRVYYESMGPHAKDKHLTSGRRVEVIASDHLASARLAVYFWSMTF